MASAGIEYWCTSSSDFSNGASPNNDNKLSAGSIAVAGSYNWAPANSPSAAIT
jgi:hypothetical protein